MDKNKRFGKSFTLKVRVWGIEGARSGPETFILMVFFNDFRGCLLVHVHCKNFILLDLRPGGHLIPF